MPVRIGVVVFPGSNCDRDTLHALSEAGAEPVALWHEQASLDGVAAVVLPGGFAYGDYLRAGVIARFSPVMQSVAAFARDGGLVLGICNGFQVLTEAHLLPGALLRNRELRFVSRQVSIAAERLDSPFTRDVGERRPLRMPVAHGEGCFYADAATPSRFACSCHRATGSAPARPSACSVSRSQLLPGNTTTPTRTGTSGLPRRADDRRGLAEELEVVGLDQGVREELAG